MGRPRKIWKRAGSDYYYTKIDGVETRLEKTEKASQRKLERILRGQIEIANGPAGGLSFPRLADKFLDYSQETNEEETYLVHRLFLQSSKDHVGSRLVSRLCEADLDDWLRKQTTWNANTKVRARAIVLAALNYGVRKLNMPHHPLKHVRPGTVDRRERILTPDERRKVSEVVKGSFADYLRALELTGARPFSEVAKVTAADVDLAEGTWTLGKWKNSRKQKGKKRVIYLEPEMLEMTRRLVTKYPEGPLFRNKNGDPWTRQALTARFRKLSELSGVAELTAYVVRHCYITDALTRGVPVAAVAELCGTSIQTIQRHYAHLDQKKDEMRQWARQAVGN